MPRLWGARMRAAQLLRGYGDGAAVEPCGGPGSSHRGGAGLEEQPALRAAADWPAGKHCWSGFGASSRMEEPKVCELSSTSSP